MEWMVIDCLGVEVGDFGDGRWGNGGKCRKMWLSLTKEILKAWRNVNASARLILNFYVLSNSARWL